jgi:hypothetical protein
VLVCAGLVAESALETLCRAFDEARIECFDTEDRERGFFVSTDRRSQVVEVPLVTLSLAVIDSRQLRGDVHPAQLAQLASSLKVRVKRITEAERRSAFGFERRVLAANASSR